METFKKVTYILINNTNWANIRRDFFISPSFQHNEMYLTERKENVFIEKKHFWFTWFSNSVGTWFLFEWIEL